MVSSDDLPPLRVRRVWSAASRAALLDEVRRTMLGGRATRGANPVFLLLLSALLPIPDPSLVARPSSSEGDVVNCSNEGTSPA